MDGTDRTLGLYILAIAVASGTPMVQSWFHRLVAKNPDDVANAVWITLGACTVALGSSMALLFLAIGIGVRPLSGPIWMAISWCVTMCLVFFRRGFNSKNTN
ncbi:MAG TPA: hypothetical protein VLA88_06760 [Candidatus Saccharimonadales bacterium]|nr:hypothetical protein [Candidatus Saccharimonadales bacterium]